VCPVCEVGQVTGLHSLFCRQALQLVLAGDERHPTTEPVAVVGDRASRLQTAGKILHGDNLQAMHAEAHNLDGLDFLAEEVAERAEGLSVDLSTPHKNI